jgi:hypothetical protein
MVQEIVDFEKLAQETPYAKDVILFAGSASIKK